MTDASTGPQVGFLAPAPVSPAAQALFDEDRSEVGFVMNASRLWAYQPATVDGLFQLMSAALAAQDVSYRQRGVIVAACASAFGDSYCSLAWATRLALVSDDETAAGVLQGDDDRLSEEERTLATWARKVARHPNSTTSTDVRPLREAGFSDAQIFAITAFIGLRVAFSTVNAALGVGPDAEYVSKAPRHVLEAVTFGRPVDPQVR